MQAVSEKSSNHQIRFGTDGWRALIAKEFTYDNLKLVCQALSIYIHKNYSKIEPIVIGYDARFLADQFAKFAAEIFNKWSIPVKFIAEPIPTPVIAYAAFDKPSVGALMFTASHNPAEYMGIKYIPEYGGPATVEITEKILTEIENIVNDASYLAKQTEQLTSAVASTSQHNARDAYMEALTKLVDFEAIKNSNQTKPVKVVYDSLHGVGKGFVDLILEDAGFEVTKLHDAVDPTFGGSLPDPSESRLTELKDKVSEIKADLGAANDGDADRFAIIAGDGEFFPANKVLPIIAKYLVEQRGFKGKLVRTLATTHLFDLLAEKLGLEIKETPVGFKWLCAAMREDDVVLAAEESGGMSILGHIPEKDGILAITLTAEVLAKTGKSLKELWAEVQEFCGQKFFYDRLDLHLAEEVRTKFVANFKDDNLETIGEFKITKRDLTEGVKLYFEDGSWLLARPSGTEATMCRVYFEGHDEARLKALVAAVQKFSAQS